jgi:hypothetical protein
MLEMDLLFIVNNGFFLEILKTRASSDQAPEGSEVLGG